MKTIILVLVVDGRGSFSAVDAHIFPRLVQSVLENIYCGGIYDFFLWQTVPLVDDPISKKLLPYCGSASWLEEPLVVSS